MNSEVALVSGGANRVLAEKIAEYLDMQLLSVDIPHFKDGEIQVYYNETIRGKHVFIIQPTFAPAENIMELLLLIDAAKRASAYKIIAVIPYFGYARQDRKDKPRTSIGAKLMSNLLMSFCPTLRVSDWMIFASSPPIQEAQNALPLTPRL